MKSVEFEIASCEITTPGTVMVLLSAKLAEHDFAVIEQVALTMPRATYNELPDGKFVLSYQEGEAPAAEPEEAPKQEAKPKKKAPAPAEKKPRSKPQPRAVLQKAKPEPTIVVVQEIPRVEAPSPGQPIFQAHSANMGPLPVAQNIPAPVG